MANEWVIVHRLSDPIDFTVADGTAILKGTLCKLTTPRTAIISSSAGDPIAGVAVRDKIASDGRTRLGMCMEAICRVNASGAITAGQPLQSAGNANNEVMLMPLLGNKSGAVSIGYALADIADNADGEIHFKVGGSH